eukprot:8484636-Ditylum_brightwellii.AAC.1
MPHLHNKTSKNTPHAPTVKEKFQPTHMPKQPTTPANKIPSAEGGPHAPTAFCEMLQKANRTRSLYDGLQKNSRWATATSALVKEETQKDIRTPSDNKIMENPYVFIIASYNNHPKNIEDHSEPSLELIRDIFEATLQEHFPCLL